MAGNNKAGVLNVSCMLKNNTALGKCDKIFINPVQLPEGAFVVTHSLH
jgi:hypothetical protein